MMHYFHNGHVRVLSYFRLLFNFQCPNPVPDPSGPGFHRHVFPFGFPPGFFVRLIMLPYGSNIVKVFPKKSYTKICPFCIHERVPLLTYFTIGPNG